MSFYLGCEYWTVLNKVLGGLHLYGNRGLGSVNLLRDQVIEFCESIRIRNSHDYQLHMTSVTNYDGSKLPIMGIKNRTIFTADNLYVMRGIHKIFRMEFIEICICHGTLT